MPYPTITVSLKKIAKNAGIIVNKCKEFGISVVGVTKACCGDPDVAGAICQGGVAMLGDSRIQNIARLKSAGIDIPMCLLRLPMLSETRDVARLAEMSLVSEMETAKALAQESAALGLVHKVVLMVDLGDLREGIMPQKVLRTAKSFAALDGIELYGLGVNFACYGGVVPTPAKLRQLIDLAEEARQATGLPMPVVSGGNSASLALLFEGKIPKGVTQLRIGEGILLGRETAVERNVLPGACPDAFELNCEIIELQKKPSMPDGEIATDAFGNKPVFKDRGIRKRAILAIGRHDIIIDGLGPRDAGAEILGASSDHLLVDVTNVKRKLAVGSIMKFDMQYGSLISGMLSPYITKVMGQGF